MKNVYIMLLLNAEDPLRKENAFKDGKLEIVKIGNSFDVEKRKIQINSSHNNLSVEEIFEYPFYNFILIENTMHSEFEQYKEPIIDKNGASLSEYYRVNKEIYNKIHESLEIKCLEYLPELVAEFDKIADENSTLVYKNQVLKNEFDDNKERLTLLEKQRDPTQYKIVINKLLRYIFNDVNINKEKTIVDALKLIEDIQNDK